MNLEQIEESLPNGFHDAEIVSINIDYAQKVVILNTKVLVGLPDEPVELRDRYRLGTLHFSGMRFVVVDPPSSDSAFLQPGAVRFSWSRLDVAECPTLAGLIRSDPSSQAYSFFVHDWYSSIHLAATEVGFSWSETESLE